MKVRDAGAERESRQAAAVPEGKRTAQGFARPVRGLRGELQAVVDLSPRMVAQRRAMERVFGGAIQLGQGGLEEGEVQQTQSTPAVQRVAMEEDDERPLQRRVDAGTVHLEDESKSAGLADSCAGAVDTAVAAAPVGETGMSNQLKAGIEALSGLDMSGVRVHRNSDKPAQLNALAYAQGNDIHLGPGQEQHLPHEAWHVVQQAQGRVKETVQMAGVGVNDQVGLETEADLMGGLALAWATQRTSAVERQDLPPGAKASAGYSGAAAPQVIQRFMMVEGVRYELDDADAVPARSNVRDLLTAVQTAFSRRGLALSVGGMRVLREWCASKGLAPYAFDSPDQVAAALVEAGYFFSKGRSGETTGPSTLGKRPGFSGDANRLEYGAEHGDTARRHVISSSTLGAAIESSEGTLQEINDFLRRHSRDVVEGTGKMAVLAARRQAWELVHNHVGNLWIGPSPINTAIGFIRSTINKALREVANSEDGVKVGTVIQMITPPQGPMDQAARTEWLNFALVLNARLVQLSDSRGTLHREHAIRFLLDASRNADLDVPQQNPGAEYQFRLRAIYAQILGTMITGDNIFRAGGTLDQFMALNAVTKVSRTSSSDSMVDVPDVGGSQPDSDEDMGVDEKKSAGDTAAKRLTALNEVPSQIDGMQVRDVSGSGMNCLIRAILVALGFDDDANADTFQRVQTYRDHLVAVGFAEAGQMLDLAGGAGAMLISLLVHHHILGAERGLVLYQRNAVTGQVYPLTIINGNDPIRLWLSNEHFRAVR